MARISKYEMLVGKVINGIYVSDYRRVTKVSDLGKKYSAGYLTVALDEEREITLDVTLDQWKKWNFVEKLQDMTNCDDDDDIVVIPGLYRDYIINLVKESFGKSLAQGLQEMLERHKLVKIYKGKRIVYINEDAIVSDIVRDKEFNPKELYLNPDYNEIFPLWDLLTEQQQQQFEDGTFDIEQLGKELLEILQDDEEVINEVNYVEDEDEIVA